MEAYYKALHKIRKAQSTKQTELDLSGLGLTELPDLLWELTCLKYLDLRNNNLIKLSPSLGKLSGCQLRCDENPLTFDFFICDIYEVMVLSPELALVGCIIFDTNYLLNPKNVDELWELGYDKELAFDPEDVEIYQEMLREAIAKKFPTHVITNKG